MQILIQARYGEIIMMCSDKKQDDIAYNTLVGIDLSHCRKANSEYAALTIRMREVVSIGGSGDTI